MGWGKYKKKKKRVPTTTVEILQLFYQSKCAIHTYIVYRHSSVVSFWLNKIICNWINFLNVGFFGYSRISSWNSVLLIQHVKLPEYHILFRYFPANWCSWAGSLPHLDLHSLLFSLCNSSLRKQPDSICHCYSAQPS